MPPRAPRSRFTLPGAVLTALALALLLATPALAGPIVFGIAVGGDPGALDVDVIASGPLGYLLNESAALQVRTLTRDGDTLVRLDLTFGREVPYTVTRAAARVRIRAEVGGRKPAVVIGDPGARQSPPPAAAARPRAGAATPPSQRIAVLKGVRPETSEGTARLMLDIDGSPAVKTFAMTQPDRIVVDLENARLPARESAFTVHGGLIRGIRMSQWTETVVRVVCDLSRPAPFRVEPVAGGLVVHLGEGVR
jgi:hypothetical protein